MERVPEFCTWVKTFYTKCPRKVGYKDKRSQVLSRRCSISDLKLSFDPHCCVYFSSYNLCIFLKYGNTFLNVLVPGSLSFLIPASSDMCVSILVLQDNQVGPLGLSLD